MAKASISVLQGDRFSVEDIRPPGSMATFPGALKHDIDFLARRTSEFVDVPCPACGSMARHFIYEKYACAHQVCDQCATQYVAPRPNPALLSEFYRQSETYRYFAEHIFPQSAETRRDRLFKPRAEIALAYCTANGLKGGVALEVGAAYGWYCEVLKESGMFKRVIGIEPTPNLAQTCRSKGIEVIESMWETAKIDVPVELVSHFEVIEHLFDPLAFLVWCRKNMRPGGGMLFSCPNVGGFDAVLLGRDSDTVDHEHINLFNTRSIEILTKRAGFTDVDVSTPGQLDFQIARDAYRNGTISRAAVGPFLAELFESSTEQEAADFQGFLRNHRRSSHMLVFARNPD